MRRCRDTRGRGCGQLLDESEFYTTASGQMSRLCRPCYANVYSRNRATRRSIERDLNRATRTSRGRAFGIEMELTGPEPSLIVNAIRDAGVNIVNYGGYRHSSGHEWELKRDSSVNGHGLELVSPKLMGRQGFEELRKVCDVLRSVCATVDRSCGLHVHHDFNGRGSRVVRRSAIAFLNRQDAIMNLVAPSRRNNGFCPRWRESAITELARETGERINHYIGPRGNLNMHAFPRHGTIELRCHAGTTQFAKIAAWVRFGQALFKAAESSQDGTLANENVTLLLSQLLQHGLESQDVDVLLRFERAGTDERRLREAVAAGVQAASVLEEMSA